MQILKESGKNSAYDKYVKTGKIAEYIWKEILENTPENLYKYLEWICRENMQIKNPTFVINFVKNFDILKPYMDNKDIMSYNIDSLLDELDVAEEKYKDKQIEKNTKKIYDKDDIKLYKIDNYAQACKYGANTKWCITQRDTPSYWEKYYRENGSFYFIINNNLPPRHKFNKIAFQIVKYLDSVSEFINIFDSEDSPMSMKDFYKYLNEWNIDIKKLEDIFGITINPETMNESILKESGKNSAYVDIKTGKEYEEGSSELNELTSKRSNEAINKILNLNEDLLDAFKYGNNYVEVFINPKNDEIKKANESTKGIILPSGDLILISVNNNTDKNYYTHDTILNFLKNELNLKLDDWYTILKNPEKGIYVQRIGNTNNIALSESYYESDLLQNVQEWMVINKDMIMNKNPEVYFYLGIFKDNIKYNQNLFLNSNYWNN